MTVDLKFLEPRKDVLLKPSSRKGSSSAEPAQENKDKVSNILNNERLLRQELQEMHKDPLIKKSIFDFWGARTEFGFFGIVIAFFVLLLGAQHFITKRRDR
jgi:hypothetical protein